MEDSLLNKTMLAARYLEPGRVEAVEVPMPSVDAGEALIRVEACGFCGSDIGIVSGVHPRAKPPLTLGHEVLGRIEALGEGAGEFAPGDRVVIFPLITCGQCFCCTHGNSHVCRSLRLYGFDVDGGMADFVTVPVSTLIKVPADLPTSLGALVEPLAVAVHGVSRATFEDVRTVAVLGAGPIGLLTALVARARDVERVLISDVLPSRLELASRLGLTSVASGEEFKARVLDETAGEGADLLFECAGVPPTALEMTALVRCRGTIVNLGVFKKPTAVDLQAVNFKELTLIGSRVYTRDDFHEAVRLASELPLAPIVTHTFPLREVQAAFACFQRGEGVCKVLISPNS